MGDAMVLDEWPLIGRDTELEMLTGCLGGRGAVVAGVAGVGKTRLARAAEAAATRAGRPVERVVATRSSRALPLAPFARLRSPDTDVAVDPLVALRQAIVGDHPAGAPVVSVDDAHLLDDASAALVHELCASGAATVLVTVRSREPAPDAVVALWKDELCERIELQPLSRHEVTALLAAALGAAVDATTAFALWRLSRGNVMHLRELVRGGLASGALAERSGLWAWAGEPHAPPRLVELLADRLADLAPGQRRAVELLALGEPLPWSHLVALLPAGEAESLLTAGLAEVDAPAILPPAPSLAAPPGAAGGAGGVGQGDGELVVRLAHPLLGDVVEAEMAVPTRRRLLGELAAATPADAEGPGERAARLALWRLDAGGPVPPELLVEAAEECLYADARLGERFARAALAAADPAVADQARLVLALHLMLSHRPTEADATLEAIDERSLPPAARVRLVVNRANNLTWALARPDDAVTLLDQAAATATGTGAGVARGLRAHSVPMLVFAGRVGEAVERAEAIVADPAASPVERLRAGLGAVPALVAAGRPERALAWAAEALPLIGEDACRRELPIALGQLGSGASLAQLLSGDLDGADALMRLGYEEGVARNVPLMRGGAALRLGQVALWRGRPRSAAALVREAVLAMRETDAGFLAWAADTLRIACALVGDTGGIADADATASTALRFPLYRTEVLRADAAVAAATGSVSDARAAAAEGAELACANGQLIQAVVLLFDLARYGDAGIAAARLDEVAGVEGALAALMRRTVAALTTHDGDALDDASRGFEDHGYDLFAAEASRAAARVHADRGLVARERRADARADGLAARCEGATTPLLAQRPAATALTRREREVAELAAHDLTDAEIARRLGLSVRTVETHLHRAYTKLGVTGRHDLTRLLDRPPD